VRNTVQDLWINCLVIVCCNSHKFSFYYPKEFGVRSYRFNPEVTFNIIDAFSYQPLIYQIICMLWQFLFQKHQ